MHKFIIEYIIYILFNILIIDYINNIFISIISNITILYLINKFYNIKTKYKYLYFVLINIIKDIILNNIICMESIIILISDLIINNILNTHNINNYLYKSIYLLFYIILIYINKIIAFNIIKYIKFKYIEFIINKIYIFK